MTMNEYQELAGGTAGGVARIERSFLGIGGESGEVLEARKKYLRGDYDAPEYRRRLVTELGGLLWYIAECATLHGLTLEDIAQANIEKLVDRAQRGVIQGDGDDR